MSTTLWPSYTLLQWRLQAPGISMHIIAFTLTAKAADSWRINNREMLACLPFKTFLCQASIIVRLAAACTRRPKKFHLRVAESQIGSFFLSCFFLLPPPPPARETFRVTNFY